MPQKMELKWRGKGPVLKDLFRENFILPFVFTPLQNQLKKKSKSKNGPLKFDLKKCPGSNRFVPCSNRPKSAVERLRINFQKQIVSVLMKC